MSAHLKYLEADIESADRLSLLIQVYDGCIGFMKSAVLNLQRGNIPEFCKNLLKAQDCVVDLIESLDYNAAPDLCNQLHRLYDAVLNFLTEANLKRDEKPVNVAITCIEKLASGYKELEAKIKNLSDNEDEKITLEFKISA
ncbi:MAG: flagellar protein FliS [Deltaproteobacteria bacterium]|nr:flagellar protein FliS [Deltaproteobacteria bacterium]